MTDTKLQKARAAAAKAAEELAALEALEAERAAQNAKERHERATKHAHDVLNSWRADDEANNKAEREAKATFLEMISQEPWFVAFAEYRAHRYKRGHILNAAQNAQGLLGQTITIPENRLYDASLADDIVEAAEERARDIAADFADQLEAKRNAYVNGGSK
ncbi:hypothetical protein [Streptomyces sp. NPDC049590]|uniref:hypothetical protein n=1 Tax=Streptomyces sp. NPDC049590 TaxID=3154834 RepID=UPI0034396117